MNAKITITERNNRDLTDRIFRWNWFWSVYIRDHGMRSGFASTRERARVKAEKAARKLARTPVERRDEYTLEVEQPEHADPAPRR